jgi:hypothetical protein
MSRLGGLGGMVAAQLGMGNATMDQMEMMIHSRDLADSILLRHSMAHKIVSDRETKETAFESGSPAYDQARETLRNRVLTTSINPKKDILTIGAEIHDSALARELVDICLEELNLKIQSGIRQEANANRAYLEQQLGYTGDPLLREKIFNLMSMELEKSMLVASRSFDVLEKAVVPKSKIRPKTKFNVLIGFLGGGFGACFLMLVLKGWGDLRARLRDRIGAL